MPSPSQSRRQRRADAAQGRREDVTSVSRSSEPVTEEPDRWVAGWGASWGGERDTGSEEEKSLCPSLWRTNVIDPGWQELAPSW